MTNPSAMDSPPALAEAARDTDLRRVSFSPALLQRAVMAPIKLFWGMIFCQGLVGSIFLVGWTYRLTQRSVLKYWCKAGQTSRRPSELGIEAGETPALHWPNWFCRQNFRHSLRRPAGASGWSYAVALLQAPIHSLCLNFWLGLQAIANTWVLTLPACLFWSFGWYDGWNNSFNKGYEQAVVGPLISIFGILWFIAAMFYVPLAQARQASTGQWRCFFQYRLIWTIVRQRWLACVGLAFLFSIFALPLNILKTIPIFLPQMNPGLASLSGPQLIKHLNDYYFWCALALLPAYVGLRLVAGRIYASGILVLVQTGKVDPLALAENERATLDRLGLLEKRPQRERHALVRFVAWTGTRVGRIVGGAALALLWFTFAAQIYVTQFLNYHGALGWLNQPLIQLPWFHYLPAHLKNPLEEVFSALFVVIVALAIWGTIRVIRRYIVKFNSELIRVTKS